MGCTFLVRLNQLGSIWYTTLCVAVQLYLLYLGLHRYRLYAEMKWPHGGYPHVWLTVYVATLTVCIPLLVLFAAFGLFKSGNLAGDHEQIGARFERIIELTPRRATPDARRGCVFCVCHSLKSCWQHAPPLPATVHVALAVCQLFAQQIMLAQLYRYGFINSGDFLNTELDFAYHRSRQLATNLPMGDTRLQGFRITSDELAESPMAPNLLPILMHARLFGIPLEFVNLAVALVSYACAYPAVFWRVSKAFSLCFSLHLAVHAVAIIYTYLAFSVLFRVQETNYYSARPVGIGQYLWALRSLGVYHPLGVVAAFVTTLVLMHVATVVLYSYGYDKYIISVLRMRKVRAMRAAAASAASNADGDTTASATAGAPRSAKSVAGSGGGGAMCCDGYGPHVVAIVVLMLIVLAKASTLYALTLLYQHEERPLILSCIIADVVYLFAWILLWLALTLKRDWHFRVMNSVREILSAQDATRTADAAGAQLQGRRLCELKNALLVMHRDHLFVTDDPIAKPSIMRHVLKSCAGDDTYWPRTNQSPANRRIPLEDCNGNVTLGRGERTPEMGCLMEDAESAATVPLAAAPYHYRMTSLPPTIGAPPTPGSRPLMGSSMAAAAGNNFGTLKHGHGIATSFQNSMIGDYGTIYGLMHHQHSHQQQHQILRQNSHRSDANYGAYTMGRTATVAGTTRRATQEVVLGGAAIPPPPPPPPLPGGSHLVATPILGRTPHDAYSGNGSYADYANNNNNNKASAKDFDSGSAVSASSAYAAGRAYGRRNSAQTIAANYEKREASDYDRRPTFHSVDLKSRPAIANPSSYGTAAKFVSFNENGVKTYGEIGGRGSGSALSGVSSNYRGPGPGGYNGEASHGESGTPLAPPSGNDSAGGSSGMSRDSSATSASNATVSTLSAKSSSNGSYFYGDGGGREADANTPTPGATNSDAALVNGGAVKLGDDYRRSAGALYGADMTLTRKPDKFPLKPGWQQQNNNIYNSNNNNNGNNRNGTVNGGIRRNGAEASNTYATSVV